MLEILAEWPALCLGMAVEVWDAMRCVAVTLSVMLRPSVVLSVVRRVISGFWRRAG
jgi:hypothetical protein